MKATMRPRGIAGHIPPTVCSVSSNSSTSSRTTHSRHQSLTNQESCSTQLSEMDSHQPYQGGLSGGMPYRRSQSMETLHTREADECENLSCHSNPCSKTAACTATVLTVRNTSTGIEGSKKHSSSCDELGSGTNHNNKENDSESSMRKANSEMGNVNRLQRRQLGSSRETPFRDRTNRSKIDDGRQKSSGFTTITGDKAKIRTLSELVPPLNGARLRPIQQQTRSAHVSGKNLCRIEAVGISYNRKYWWSLFVAVNIVKTAGGFYLAVWYGIAAITSGVDCISEAELLMDFYLVVVKRTLAKL